MLEIETNTGLPYYHSSSPPVWFQQYEPLTNKDDYQQQDSITQLVTVSSCIHTHF